MAKPTLKHRRSRAAEDVVHYTELQTSEAEFGADYYVKAATAGLLCCTMTHGALCPLDVVKTRMQLQPDVFNKGMLSAARSIAAAEGPAGFATGLGPTVAAYAVQGWFKFGGVEFFKIHLAHALGDTEAWKYRTPIYLVSAACAEFIADIFLCPLEATRIRLVSNPTYASGLLTAFPKILAEEGAIKGFYSGFGPILFKQIPYTCAKFAVQGNAAQAICGATGVDIETASDATKLKVALSSGTLAGVAAAIISHPADTLLSMINKSETAGGTGSIPSRLVNLARETGIRKLCLNGLGARCVMIGTLTAGQFAIFDTIMALVGAEKFHFHNPADGRH